MACSASKDEPATPAPRVQLDLATCEMGMEALVAFDGTKLSVQGLAAAPDGTLYFTQSGVEAGLYALRPSLRIERVSPADQSVAGDQLWIDGNDVLVHAFGRLQAVSRTTGQVTTLANVGNDAPEFLGGSAAFDGTNFYVTAKRYLKGGAEQGEVWRVARHGGTPELVFSSTDPTRASLAHGSLALSNDTVFLGAFDANERGHGAILQMPKAGGAMTVLRANAYDSVGSQALALVGADLYAAPFLGNVTRWPTDPNLPPTSIDGLPNADAMVSDGTTAYAAFTRILEENGNVVTRFAIARLPQAQEAVNAAACIHASNSAQDSLHADAMALDASYVYAILRNRHATGETTSYLLVRVRR